MSDFIPKSDGDFDTWQRSYISYADEHSDALGFTREEISALIAARDRWDASYVNQATAANAARAATALKNEDKGDLITLIRTFTRLVQANPDVTNGQRAGLGITVADTVPTPIEPPKVAPLVRIEHGTRLQHIVRIYNREGGRSKPEGAAAVEVWYALGEPPVNQDDLRYAGSTTSSKFLREYTGDEANQTAYYWLRYTNPRGQHGPWSTPTTATIAA